MLQVLAVIKIQRMASLPELVHATPQGGTIHKYELTGGKSSFLRFLGCYLGSCKFCNDMEEATKFVQSIEFTDAKELQTQ